MAKAKKMATATATVKAKKIAEATKTLTAVLQPLPIALELDIKSLTPTISELERIANWAWERTGTISKKRIVVTIQTKGNKSSCLGWMLANGWTTNEIVDGEELHEINVSAEALIRTPHQIAATIIHEIVHLSNENLGVKDCSKGGRHNKKFAAAATAIGLDVQEPTDAKGHAYTSLSDELDAIVAETLQPDALKFDMFRKEIAKAPKQPSKTKTYTCECGITIRVAAGENAIQLDGTCNVCEQVYYPKE